VSDFGRLTRADDVARLQEALREDGLDGWLFFEFHGQNPISKVMLGLDWTTRRSFTLIPAEGEPHALIHAIEHSSWRHWPFKKTSYSGWREMEAKLGDLLADCSRVATEISDRNAVPTLDLLPSGIVQLLGDHGVELVPSGNLVSQFYSVWSADGLQEHMSSAEVVKQVAVDAFQRAADAVRAGSPLTEGALSTWIRAELPARGISFEVDCIVAIGPRAADPHYSPDETGEIIAQGDVLLIDLWGKATDGGIPADQTWMGILSDSVPDGVQDVWETVRNSRDAAVDFLRERFQSGEEVQAFEVDDVARGVIRKAGYGDYFVHRTGHSIDTALHGSGPNLDNLETRDDRKLVPGVGFSVEPGIYQPDELGVRSELNVYWGPEGPVVTPSEVQQEIFRLLP
jgi:Xaa-Pro aminopeptidase